jgi:hypothetical protein
LPWLWKRPAILPNYLLEYLYLTPIFSTLLLMFKRLLGRQTLLLRLSISFEDSGLAVVGAPAGIDGESFGALDASLLAVYSDGGAGMGAVNATGGPDKSWGVGGSLAGALTETTGWYLGGSFTSGEVLSNGFTGASALTRENTYLTGSLIWSPMLQHTVTAQLIYEQAKLSDSTLTTSGEALTFLNYWIYRL